jgi:N-acetylglucosamine malate deacetylase 2
MHPEPKSKLPEIVPAEHPAPWMRFFDRDAGFTAHQASQPRGLFLVAHPDDETIGASTALYRLPRSIVVYLTDGAPHDPRFWSLPSSSREEYAQTRLKEAWAALSVCGILPQQILGLGAADQAAIYEVPRLVEPVIRIVRWFRPAVLITHAYEGGHPDHDAAALVASTVRRCLQREQVQLPSFLEMTSYHACEGKCRAGEFLPSSSQTQRILTIGLAPEQKRRKKKMLECFVSQAAVIAGFPLEPERLREAPEYDFSRPPHAGPLWYELLGWSLTSSRWRELATRVVQDFGESLCA